MGKIRLAVAGESLYTERLTECIQKNAPEYLEVLSCGILQELPEFLTQMQPDVLLSDQGTVVEDGILKHILHIQLVDHAGLVKEKNENQMQIFRYQKGSEILRQVFEIYALHSKKNLVYQCKTTDMEMAAFYAPGGHELLLPFSISYAAFCGKDKKVLYLNLSEFSGMKMLFHEQDGNNLSDLIFGIRQKKKCFLLCLQSVLHHAEHFDYVLPPENPEDLYEIQEDDLTYLLTLLQEQTEYKMIIWNCGSFTQTTEQVMEYSGKVFCIIKDYAYGRYRKKEFEKYLQKEWRKHLREKITYVNPQIGNTGFVQGVDILTQLQSGEFMKQIQKLTEEEVNREKDGGIQI